MDAASFKEMLASVGRALEECEAVPMWALSDSALIDRLNWTSALLEQIEELQLILLRGVDRPGMAAQQGLTSTAEWLQDRYGVSALAAAGLVQLAELSTVRARPR